MICYIEVMGTMTQPSPRVLLLTPPMVQLNTPYPATPVLTGFLKEHGVDAHQADLSLEVALRLFTRPCVEEALARLRRLPRPPAKTRAFLANGEAYADNVEAVVAFLQGRAPELAWRLSRPGMLPEGPHFRELAPDAETDPEETLDALFGSQGIEGRAKMRASLFLDDLAGHLAAALDPDFAFARYAEHLAVAAPAFDPILKRLDGKPSYIDAILDELVAGLLEKYRPDFVGATVPFPGTVYGAFRIARTVKRLAPATKTLLGGGYVNSELRDLTDERVFDYFDFISYDEGFDPLLGVLGLGPRVRTRTRGTTPEDLRAGVAACGRAGARAVVRVSDYADLDLSRYLSLIETANPMHRLWSDGRWLKVQLASGCYWHRCRFCDVALDYIGRYAMPDPAQAVDAMLQMRDATGVRAFHFTDEAIPPALIRRICRELLRRREKLVWWGNIRFDTGFTPELAALMAEAGCIAVTGGLECAHNRLLKLMDKGITCESAREACESFADAGILVHAYLMYGYPTETKAETLEALAFVRDLFADGCIQSAFWHRFALTVHSPLAADPPKGMRIKRPARPKHGHFALNELACAYPGDDVDGLGRALSLATYNYMLGRGLDLPVEFWLKQGR